MRLIAEKLGAITLSRFFALVIVVLSTLSVFGYVFYLREKILCEIQMENENIKLITNVSSLKKTVSHRQKKYADVIVVDMMKILRELDRFHLKDVVVKEVESTEDNLIKLRVFSVSALVSYSQFFALIDQVKIFGVSEFGVMLASDCPPFLNIKMKLYGLCDEK